MKFQTTEEAADFIVRIVGEEATRLGIKPDVKREQKKRTNELTITLKQNEQTFWIRFNWVRDECLGPYEPGSGFGAIGCPRTEWRLALEPANLQAGELLPYCWRLETSDESLETASHPRILEEEWLRRLIRKKLAAVHD